MARTVGSHPVAKRLARNADKSLSAIAEEPPTPLWELILEQFKDQLVLILLGSAAVSFVLALFEDEGGWSAFVDPAVVSLPPLCAYSPSDRTGPDLTTCLFSRSSPS